MKRFLFFSMIFACSVLTMSAQNARGALGNLPDLVGPLKATPGCLGVETAQTGSGKFVIFAWFEDRKALLNWYSSDLHQQLMTMGPPPNHPPLQDIADGTGPILAIASLTPSASPGTSAQPYSQIAIELYQPLPGGAYISGRFAPSSVKVPGMRGTGVENVR
jgi:hypothetical protein